MTPFHFPGFPSRLSALTVLALSILYPILLMTICPQSELTQCGLRFDSPAVFYNEPFSFLLIPQPFLPWSLQGHCTSLWVLPCLSPVISFADPLTILNCAICPRLASLFESVSPAHCCDVFGLNVCFPFLPGMGVSGCGTLRPSGEVYRSLKVRSHKGFWLPSGHPCMVFFEGSIF